MEQSIKQITVISGQGVKSYEIGQTVNGMVIDTIAENTIEYESAIEFVWTGLTAEGLIVLSIINAPVVIEYNAN